MEIYNNKIYDRNLKGNIIVKENQISEKEISSIVELKECFDMILFNRITADNKVNLNSSRSHLVIKLRVGSGVVNLVDLAGSERMASGASNVTDQETTSINSSLLSLKSCIVDQFKNNSQQYKVNFNGNILTKLLKESLDMKNDSKNVQTVIITTVCTKVEYINMTKNTLDFVKDVTGFWFKEWKLNNRSDQEFNKNYIWKDD